MRMLVAGDDCIRCGEEPGIDELGYCGHCHWVVLAEVEEGWRLIGDYLRNWAAFSDWELAQPAAGSAVSV